jgi:hypothetical protein
MSMSVSCKCFVKATGLVFQRISWPVTSNGGPIYAVTQTQRHILAIGLLSGVYTTAQASGLQAELRSSSAQIPQQPGPPHPLFQQEQLSLARNGWVCDAAQGFRPIVAIDNTADPVLGVGTGSGMTLPISPAAPPANCGQMALASAARCILRRPWWTRRSLRRPTAACYAPQSTWQPGSWLDLRSTSPLQPVWMETNPRPWR